MLMRANQIIEKKNSLAEVESDYKRCEIKDCMFYVELHLQYFENCTFINCNFDRVRIANCDFKECTFRACSFDNVTIDKSFFYKCTYEACTPELLPVGMFETSAVRRFTQDSASPATQAMAHSGPTVAVVDDDEYSSHYACGWEEYCGGGGTTKYDVVAHLYCSHPEKLVGP